MSYEVYIDVRHHPRHNEDDERRESTCFKFTDGKEPIEYVIAGLLDFAHKLDPTMECMRCGESRGDHHRDGSVLRCWNRYGPLLLDPAVPNHVRMLEGAE